MLTMHSATTLVMSPTNTGLLTALERLNLCENQLTALPESIGSCTNLLHILLSNNQLLTVADRIGG
jgi:Leucine-rich repeat (LRR) protein